MASTPQTRGFEVGVVPNVRFAEPQLFNGAGAIGVGVGQGVGIGAKLQDIMMQREQQAYEQSLRPYKQQLMDVQLEAAQTGLAGAKTRNHLTDLTVPQAEATASKDPVIESFLVTEPDEEGNLIEWVRETRQNPITKEIYSAGQRRNRTIKTAEQVKADAAQAGANLEATKALATQRGREKDPRFESELILRGIQSAKAAKDADGLKYWEARQQALNTRLTGVTDAAVANRRTATMGVDAGFTFPQIEVLRKSPAGLSAMRKMKAANHLIETGEYVPEELTLTAAEKNAVAGVAALGEAEVVTPVPVPTASAATPSPAAIALLKSQPELAPFFNEKYGEGAAAAYLIP